MKNLLVILILLMMMRNSVASHMMGGEITWECDGSKYIFTLKIYRDCRGASFGSLVETITVTNHPTISTINVYSFAGSYSDISPQGCPINCTDSIQHGSVEEFIFRSNPINLGNVPPPSAGWIFSWSLCCRNATIQNITGPGGLNMTLRSKMFSFNGQPVSPCYNSSPVIAERPRSFICSGYEFNYTQTAFDNELDSLSYNWDFPGDGTPPSITTIPYCCGYTDSAPMPGSITLDGKTGVINYFPAPGITGDFVSCIRVDEFRCGVKISEVYREWQIGIAGTCAPVCGALNTAPFAVDQTTLNPVTVLYDTVFAGDTVNFLLSIRDTNMNVSCNGFQHVIADIYSPQLADVSGMCLIPPCATVTPQLPNVFYVGSLLDFNWVTSCSHVASFDDCYQARSLYQFVINLRDNTCPSPANNNVLLNIVVLGPDIYANGDTLFTNFTSGTLQWYLDGVPIPGAIYNNYITIVEGVYSVVATVSGCSVPSAIYDNTCNISADISGDNYLCPSETGVLSTSGQYQAYQWYVSDGINAPQMIPGANGNSINITQANANSYFSVVVSQGGCSDTTEQVLVHQYTIDPPELVAYGNFTLTGDSLFTVCYGNNMYIGVPVNYSSNITWFNNGIPLSTTMNMLTVASPGSYTMQGATSWCPSYILAADTLFNVEVVVCSGVNENFNNDWSIYPNPAHEYIYINSTYEVFNFTLYDMTGRIMLMKQNAKEIPVESEPGIYYYRLSGIFGERKGSVLIMK